MDEKKLHIRSKYGKLGFTFPQRFQNCWQDSWKKRMHDRKEFEEQKTVVAKECSVYMERCSRLIHRDRRVEQFVELTDFLQKKIFGAGDLIPKHLVPILSVLGILPPWMSSMSYLKANSTNYLTLVEKYRIGQSQKSANKFLRALGFAIKRPMTPMGSDEDQPTVAASVLVGRPDRKVDVLYGENVSCKFIRIVISGSDNKYLDLIFLGQYLYIPNVEDGSLTVLLPGQSNPRIIRSGALHSWKAEEAMVLSPIVDVPLPRKVTRRMRIPDETSVPRKQRKRDESGVARLPEPSPQPLLIWVPKEIDRSRGLFQQAITNNNNVIETFQRHVEMIKLEGGIRSHFTIDLHSKARRQYHTLRSVTVNKKEFLMGEVNL